MQEHHSDIDRITLWTRSSPSVRAPNRERALELAAELDGGGVDVGVEWWGKTVDRTGAAGASALDDLAEVVDAFAEWAEHADRSLDPFFRTRRLEETTLADAREIQRLPTVALAEYADGDLVHVAPSRSGGRVVDVVSRLEAIAGEERSTGSLPGRRVAAGRD